MILIHGYTKHISTGPIFIRFSDTAVLEIRERCDVCVRRLAGVVAFMIKA